MQEIGKRLLVTGGAGYIGTHTCVELIEAGHNVVVIDNLCNSKAESLLGVERITGVQPELIEADLRDLPTLHNIFGKYRPDVVNLFDTTQLSIRLSISRTTLRPLTKL